MTDSLRTQSSTRLRAAFEGEGLSILRHMRMAARLKNEWPDLFDAIEESLYLQPTVDVRSMADSVLRIAEDLSHPLTEIRSQEIQYPTSLSSLSHEIVESYLSGAIRFWRKIAANADHKHFDIAPYYVDAYQSVRLSLLGDTLGVEDDT